MFGVSEIKDVFGTMTVAFVIEIIIAIIGIWIAYKKLKDKIIGSYKERQKQKTDIKEALDAVKAVDTLIETCNNIQAGIETNQKKLNERRSYLWKHYFQFPLPFWRGFCFRDLRKLPSFLPSPHTW